MDNTKITKAVLILGISIFLSSFIFGLFFFQTRANRDTLHVVGSATKRYDSDIVKWRLSITRSADMNDLKGGYNAIQKDMKSITDYLQTNGIQEKDITVQPIHSDPKFERDGRQNGYNLRQSFFVVSNDIPKMDKFALNPSFIFEKGIILESSNLEYYFSKLPDIKRELLAEATKDARKRAEEIAKNADVRIDKLIYARAGVFQITEPYSTEVTDYGIYNTSTKQKDITITVSNTFTLK